MKALGFIMILIAVCMSAPGRACGASLRDQARRQVPTPSPAPTPLSSPSPSPSPRVKNDGDNAYSLVGGVWSCKTFAGNSLKHTFRRDEDAVSLIAETTVEFDGRRGSLSEIYRYHRDAQKWVVSLVHGKFVATAAQWVGSQWVFSGEDFETGGDQRVRIVYTSPKSEVFRREFERFVNGRWQTYAGETCLRRPI